MLWDRYGTKNKSFKRQAMQIYIAFLRISSSLETQKPLSPSTLQSLSTKKGGKKKKQQSEVWVARGSCISLFSFFPPPTHYDGEVRKRFGWVSSILKHGKARKNGSRIIANHYRFSSWFSTLFSFRILRREPKWKTRGQHKRSIRAIDFSKNSYRGLSGGDFFVGKTRPGHRKTGEVNLKN